MTRSLKICLLFLSLEAGSHFEAAHEWIEKEKQFLKKPVLWENFPEYQKRFRELLANGDAEVKQFSEAELLEKFVSELPPLPISQKKPLSLSK
jgi:hypothetical protein